MTALPRIQPPSRSTRLDADGVNIEDCTRGRLIPPQAHTAKITAIKDRCPDPFVNARVDTFWTAQDATVVQTIERALHYSKRARTVYSYPDG